MAWFLERHRIKITGDIISPVLDERLGGITGLKLLLDTHVILWSASEPERIPRNIAVINQEVAIQSLYVDLPHQYPADRFLAASAMGYGLSLVTANKRLTGAKEFPVLPIP